MIRPLAAILFLLGALAAPGRAQEPQPPEKPPAPRLFQRLSRPDAEAAVAEWKAAGLEPEAVVLPTDTEYNDARHADAVEAAAGALFAAGVKELWLEIGVSGQTLDPENALLAARVYVKRVPRAKGLVVHWLYPRRFLPEPRTADPWLREFAGLGLPLIVMGDPEARRTLEYTGLEWDKVEAIAQVQAVAPDLYFANSIFEFEEREPDVVGTWIDELARIARVPVYPCLRVRTAIDAKRLDLDEFAALLEMVAARAPKAVLIEASAAKDADWPRWRDAIRKGLGR